MIDTNELRKLAKEARFGHMPLEISGSEVLELLDQLEAAEGERDALRALVDILRSEISELRAKIAQVKKQEPVAWIARGGYPVPLDKLEWQLWYGSEKPTLSWVNQETRPLYALPGAQAQPAPSVPSVPDGWLPAPEKHLTFDPVDLRLSDGSVLCGCLPQSDGDYWWEGPSGEVFIDPKYASVTHWRLAAAPEAKP